MKTKKIIITISLVLVSLTVFVIAISATGAKLSATKETTESTTVDVNADFIYELKDEYDSYTDVKKEVVNLWDAFDDYREENFPGFSYDDSGILTAESKQLRKRIDESKCKAENYEELLWKYAVENFTAEEIDIAEKEEELQKKLATLSDSVVQYEEIYNMVSLSKKSEKRQDVNLAKDKLEAAERVVEDFENGLISLDEALEKLGITYGEDCIPKEMRAVQRKVGFEKQDDSNGEFSTAAN